MKLEQMRAHALAHPWIDDRDTARVEALARGTLDNGRWMVALSLNR